MLRRITAKRRDLPKNIRAISLEWLAKCNDIFKKALLNRRLLLNMDETTGAKRDPKPLPRDSVTGAIIRPHDEEGNLIVKTRKPRKNKEIAIKF